MTRYHTNEEGKTLPCDNPAKCPYGAFDSPEESRAAYEKSMGETQVAPPLSKAKGPLSQRELNDLAKGSSDVDELQRVAELGGERALRSLAGNPGATGEQLALAHGRTTNRETLDRLEMSPNFPLPLLSDEVLRLRVRRDSWRGAVPRHNSIDDATADRLRGMGVNVLEMAANPDNQLSREKVAELAKDVQNPDSLRRLMRNPKFIPNLDGMGSRELQAVALGADQDLAREALERVLADHPREAPAVVEGVLFGNRGGQSAETLAWLADHELVSNGHSLLAIYLSNNSDPETRARVRTRSSMVDDYAGIQEKVAANPEAFENLRARTSKTKQGLKYFYRFDPQALNQAGLTNAHEVDSYVRHYLRDYLFGPEFDPETGTYQGSID